MTKKDLNINDIEFFDGETIDDKYFQLGNSKEYVINLNGLRLRECLDFLYNNSPKNANSYFFRIDYDLNMFFNNENFEKNEEKILDFFNGEKVKFYDYELQYFRHKIFVIRKGKTRRTFYDVSNFLHTSFIKTLKLFEVEINKEELKFLTDYKLKRSNFNAKDIENIINYNKLECKLGIKLTQKIYNLLPENLKTTRLYGSSSLSHKFLKDRQIDKVNAFFRETLNDKIFESAYYGGRMEALKIGKIGKCYKYDINSAYPNIIKDLREVKSVSINNNFKNSDKIIPTNLYFIELEIKYDNMIGLLPYRLKSGYLVFPKFTKGYYYGVEIIEAIQYEDIKYKITQEIKIELGNKIFNEIENLYNLRLKLKKKKDLRNLVYKILLNSIYGKFAQQTGKHQFLNFYYAGLITSGTRAELLKAVRETWVDVIFFATDGILTASKLDLPISEKLGFWEEDKYKSAYVVQSGVYELTNYKNEKSYAERGFRTNFKDLLKSVKKKGTFEIKNNIFIGNKYFAKNYKAFKGKRCRFIEIKRLLNINNQFKRFYLDLNLRSENDSYLLNNEDIKIVNKQVPIENFDFEDFELYNLEEFLK